LEVVVGAGLEAVFGVQLDGAGEIAEAVLGAAGDGVEQGEAVEGIVGVGLGGKDVVELLASFLVVAGIQHGDGVVVMLLGGEEGEFILLHLTLAGTHIHFAAFHELGRRGGEELFKGSQSSLVLALLHELHGGLVMLKSGSRARGGVDAGYDRRRI
jgi:hypothetical protein